jgi:MFS transporter, ACS family, tartrate transporter
MGAEHGAAEREQRIVRKVAVRLMPFLGLMYVIAYLDRVNVSFAETQLGAELGFSATAYGLGAGLFFAGYVLFEVPSNLVLVRVGARRWLGRIMVSWGIVAAAMALVQDVTSFYALRFLLGVAEAGFFPGVILYLTQWFPAAERGRAMALFIVSLPIAFIVGSPISGALLELDGVLGLDGFRWLFLIEALPAVAVGIWAFSYLDDRPEEAKWLEEDERAWLVETLRAEASERTGKVSGGVRAALTSGRVLLLATVYLALVTAAYGVAFFIPDLVERIDGLGNVGVGAVSTIPYIAGGLGMLVFARWSDRSGKRRRVVVVGMAVGALFTAAAAFADPVLAILALGAGAFGLLGANPVFWTLPAALLSGSAAAAAGIALINSIGTIGGLIGPVMMGVSKDAYGTTGPALVAFGVIVALGACLATAIRAPSCAGTPGGSLGSPAEEA